ncbi:MAG TPA: ATP-dependent DNA helicase [Xanthomonadaceae bacterium]|nr:ATP-dependent DNA helicase [Xanthomonadaceae bacterium]
MPGASALEPEDATLHERAVAALSAVGAFAGQAGFSVRLAQQHLAGAVADTIGARATLVAEAGTGTGKTWAYLVPLLLSGARAIVSTGTRALQDQLFHRDLPQVRRTLGVALRAALLKGRSNYVCWYRLERSREEGRFGSREEAAQLMAVRAFAQGSRSGDLAECTALPEDSALRPRVTSTAENCLGSECPFWSDCFVVKARAAAQAADLVVVNHHLLFADVAIRREGFGEILPGADAFVVDEAHQLPELAGQFFGHSVSSRQLLDLARDVLAECAGVPGALEALQAPGRTLVQRVRELRLALDPLGGRGTLAHALAEPEVGTAIDALAAALAELCRALAPLGDAAVGFEACGERTRLHADRLTALVQAEADGCVRWYELSARGFTLNATPLDVSGPLREFREATGAAWVFTSATLAVAGSVGHFAARVGIDEPVTLIQASPFDYPRQALAYLPGGLPEPSHPGHTEAVLQAVVPVLRASMGRAFVLFTSHRALRAAAERLPELIDFPLFVQGTAPRHALLDAFRASGNGVLLGAASFWEGVDVAGEALSVVAIDKLPFEAPGDPVLEARLDAIRRARGNPFRDHQLPAAVIALKQGVGRLIRTVSDRGVLVLCDPRLLSKSYGRVFLESLPPFPVTRELADVEAFLARSGS